MKNNSRQNKTRFKLKKVTNRSRLSVFKSNNHVYAQIISDQKGITIASASSLEKNLITEKLTRKELAERVGKEIAKRSIKKGVKNVAFDKGKYKYHGIIKIIADISKLKKILKWKPKYNKLDEMVKSGRSLRKWMKVDENV